MRCVDCRGPARLVVDYHPEKARGAYADLCWPCYHKRGRVERFPIICNYIDKDDHPSRLQTDSLRQRLRGE